MKRIYLLRHAKSDWEAEYDTDHERPLNRRGRTAAAQMGQYLTTIDQAPDLVVTSSAVRARDTVELAMSSGSWDCPVEVTRDLYATSPSSVVHLVQTYAGSHDRLLLVGHEPTWSELASSLIGGGHIKLPTAAIARIDFDVDGWPEVDVHTGTLAWVVTPKLLGRLGFGV
jgi:phosphohistidine phosphatase